LLCALPPGTHGNLPRVHDPSLLFLGRNGFGLSAHSSAIEKLNSGQPICQHPRRAYSVGNYSEGYTIWESEN